MPASDCSPPTHRRAVLSHRPPLSRARRRARTGLPPPCVPHRVAIAPAILTARPAPPAAAAPSVSARGSHVLANRPLIESGFHEIGHTSDKTKCYGERQLENSYTRLRKTVRDDSLACYTPRHQTQRECVLDFKYNFDFEILKKIRLAVTV